MKRVLVIAYYFPPIAASGSMRPLGFCRYLRDYGWQPRVLTTTPQSVYPSINVDSSLLDQVPNSIQLDRVPHETPEAVLLRCLEMSRELRHRMFTSKNKSMVSARLSQAVAPNPFGTYRRLRKIVLEWALSFPDAQCFWLKRAVRRLWNIAPTEYPDAVFATAGPWTSLLVGKALAKKFGVPFVADFRDPWTHNPNRQQFSAALFERHKRLEKEICKWAVKIIANTDELTAQFRRDYPGCDGKFITITNGFDDRGWTQAEDSLDIGFVTPADSATIELSHFGTIYGNRDPFPLMLALDSLLEEKRICSDQLRVRLIGDWFVENTKCNILAEKLEKHGLLNRSPTVPHNICLEQMASAQVLLVLQPAYPLQVPGKIYEYIATGRPIVVIGGEGATASLIDRCRLGQYCCNDTRAIKELLFGIANRQVEIRSPNPTTTKMFHYRNLTQKLAALLDSVTAVR